MGIFQKINIKQPKYMLPLIVYLPVLATGYFVIDMFNTDTAEIPDKSMTTTEYLNPALPSAKMKGDGIGGKYESMVKSYGQIEDFTAIDNIDRYEEDKNQEEYASKYTDKDLALLDANAASDAEELSLQEKLQASANKGASMGENEEERLKRSQEEQQKTIDELNKTLAQLRLNNMNANGPDSSALRAEGKIEINEKLVQSPAKDDEPQQVVKRMRETSDYFNTLADNESEPKMIKAIIDEDIKAVEGSRVRLRLLDDIEINEAVLKKGSYLCAIMSGFGSQRVKGNVGSVLIGDEIVKISLALYDTDGLEGLYVPSSRFRETTKDIASGAMSGNMNMGTANDNSLSQWGMQAIQNAYQKTTNAVGKAIKKNKVKLKYGTFVYLVNGKEKRK